MKYISQQSTPTIQVTFQLTTDELELITLGIGSTSETSRITVGMSKQQSQSVGKFYNALCDACKEFGVAYRE